jgi:hypothetical protein
LIVASITKKWDEIVESPRLFWSRRGNPQYIVKKPEPLTEGLSDFSVAMITRDGSQILKFPGLKTNFPMLVKLSRYLPRSPKNLFVKSDFAP